MAKTAKQCALVTGGSRGIGRAIATALGKQGFSVAVNYVHNVNAANEVVLQIEQAGGRAVAVRGVSPFFTREVPVTTIVMVSFTVIELAKTTG